MKKGRPGGNPDLKKYQFTTTREYPLTKKVTLRIDEPTSNALKAGKLPDWSEIARQAIEKALAEVEEKNIKSA
ncbi:MAG: hypothetical protein QNJ54_36110 [Prochloraceae cyanobacterium]|nr:hypothetical protein [Prochloraceae cyanobacterium]